MGLGIPAAAPGQTAPAPLTTAAEVLGLPATRAATRVPVALRGVVTAAEPDWAGRFILQDATGGIWINATGRQPAIGDLLEVTGASSPGSFAPTVQQAKWEKVGTAELPAPRHVTVERLMAGVEDGQRIEISGLVRSARLGTADKLMLEVSIGGHRVRVYPKLPPHLNPQALIAAKVRARGTAATVFNPALRQLTAMNLFVPTSDDFIIEQPELHPPFDQPPVPLGDIARYRADATLGERIHVSGTLTFQRVGEELFIQDATGALRIESRQPLALPLGAGVEAVGFLEFVDFQPVLRDAVLRRSAQTPPPLPERTVPFSELRNGRHPGELLTLRGVLVARSVRPVQRDHVPFVGSRVTCTIQNEDLTFTAEYEDAQPAASPALTAQLGSVVELRGVAAVQTTDDGRLRALNLLLPEARSLRVLAAPSWFTAERLLYGLGGMCVVLAGVAAWSVTVSKKNAMLSFLIAEREKAQKELQAAHDQLEERVRERTEQLKIEMTARKTAELEFRAVLSERTRLARELHDTLEQALTGIALQLDTAAKLFARNAPDAGQRLETARELLKKSQLELHRSIWDLRSRELEQFDLAHALAAAARQITADTAVRATCETVGERRSLPESVEDNLLRIGQEALTNVVKHSGATAATLRLEFTPRSVLLEVRDNGSGFVPDQISAQPGGHFGLIGMSERAKRLGGRLEVSGSPGEGTTVRIVVPLEPAGGTARETVNSTLL